MKLGIQHNTVTDIGLLCCLLILCFGSSNSSDRDGKCKKEEYDLRQKVGEECKATNTISCLVDNSNNAKLFFDKCLSNPADKDKDSCPKRRALTALVCNLAKVNPRGSPRYCEQCKLDGAECSADSECCSSYYSVAPELGFRQIFASSRCTKGRCTACLPEGSPCKDARLQCCDEITRPNPMGYECRRSVWYDAVALPPYDICAPNPCRLAAPNSTKFRQVRCLAGISLSYPKKYDSINFCQCPKDLRTGYKCSDGCEKKCIECGLEGANCVIKDDCCDFHDCDAAKKKCMQKDCVLQGGSCATKACCGKLNCLRKFKFCTLDECKMEGEVCRGGFQCCEPLSCLGSKSNGGPPKCGKAPPPPPPKPSSFRTNVESYYEIE